MRCRATIPRALALMLVSVLLLAAVWKATNPAHARTALVYLGLVPYPNHPAALAAPAASVAVEIFLAILLLALGPRRPVVAAVFLLLLGYSFLLLALASRADSPSCGCLPSWLFRGSGRHEAIGGLVRNVGLLLTCAVLWATNHRPADTSRNHANAHHPERHGAPAGFTVIELLVVIAILAILVSLTVPALSHAREHAREARALAHLRHTFASLSLYTEDNHDLAPFLGVPEQPWEPIVVNGVVPKDHEYFDQNHYYVNSLYPGYCQDWEAIANENLSHPPDFLFARFWLAQGAFATPLYWRDDDPPDDLRCFRGVPLARILFPSSKGLLLDTNSGMYARPQRPAAPDHLLFAGLADGSASSFPEVPEMFDNIVERPFHAAPWPVLGTRHGFEGRDF